MWWWHDSIVSLATFAFLPFMYKSSPGWHLAFLYMVVYALKVAHMYALRQSRNDGELRGSMAYMHSKRNAFIILERVLRISSSWFTGKEAGDQPYQYTPAPSSPVRLSIEVLKRAFAGTGSTVILWHAFMLPTVWNLEPALLLPLVIMTLHSRGPPTAAFLASCSAHSGLQAAKHKLAELCSNACRVAVMANHAASTVCVIRGATGLEYDKHLTASLMIFGQYLLPLYLR